MSKYSLVRRLLQENVDYSTTVLAADIFPIQRDLNAAHVLPYYKYPPRRPILCVQGPDELIHVLDGHHGWAGACLSGNEVKINVIKGDPETIWNTMLQDDPNCEGSKGIPPELDIKNPENDIGDLIRKFKAVDLTPEDIEAIPNPRVNQGRGIPKRKMPQCDHLRR